MDSATASKTSEIWGDIYSCYRALYDNPAVVNHRYYFQNLKGDNFQRPSYLVKLVTARNRGRNIATRWAHLDIMVQHFAETEWDAITGAEQVANTFSGFPQVLLHKWDFSGTVPSKISISGVDQYGGVVPSAMGIRIDPDSVTTDITQTEDKRWQSSTTFTMVSPRRADLGVLPLYLTAISYQLLTYQLILPTPVEINMTASLSATVN